jgi:YVTN family beta-propeller protein
LTNRLYCADYLANAVTIIDCAADTVIVTFPAPESPRALCLNPLNNKVYVGCEDVPDGLIIDGNTNAAETTFALSYTTALAYDPDSNRVYAVGLNSDVVCMDGATDSVLASTSVGYDLEAVCYDRVTNRVFCADYDDDVQCVLILDGTTLARLSAVAQEALPNALCFNPTALKLYCANEVYNTVTVIDAGANAVLRNIPVGTRPYLLAHATAVNKLYCANSDDRWTRDSSFSVIDCIADSVIGAIHLSFRPSALLYNPSTNRLYCASGSDSSVKVLDCASNGFTATIRTGRVPVALVMNAAGSRLFSANSSGRSVTVIDATADTAVAEVMLWRQPTAMAYNPVNDHVYCATSDSGRVFVVRSDPPGIVNYVETGGYGIRQVCYVPHENKVYCTRYNGVTVIDCYTDSVVKQIPTSASAGPLSCDTVNRWVYCADPNARTVSVIDAARDSIVAVLPAGDVVALAWNPVDLRTYAANHDDGTITVIRDSLHVGVAESYKLQATSRKPAATIVRGALFLPAFPFTLHSSLFSLSGAKVLDLKPGPNDVRHLSPGVYFVRQASGVLRDASSVTKVVVTR